MRKRLAAACAVFLLALSAPRAANLDITSAYQVRSVGYSDLNLNGTGNASFIYDDARLGLMVNNVGLDTPGGGETVMDVGIKLHALGAAGYGTLPLAFERAAENYPSANMTPFFENAYLRVRDLWNWPVAVTLGRQSYKLGSGLLLDDDGAGLTGVSAAGGLPFWDMKLGAFAFSSSDNQIPPVAPQPTAEMQAPGGVGLYGLSLGLPTDGLWELNELLEKGGPGETAYGCTYAGDASLDGCALRRALRSFTELHYAINYGPIFFDGDAAMERGAADLAGAGAPASASYRGDAEVLRAKWKQRLFHMNQEGIARVVFARGSGQNPSEPTTLGAFFPSHGHQYDGLIRSGFGNFFQAAPYSAYGGNYSSSTASGMPVGDSGVLTVGAGFTPPAYKGFILDVDYFLFQADRAASGNRTLGGEWDLGLRYPVRDAFTLEAAAGFFSVGTALDASKGSARSLSFTASGKF